MKNQTPDQKANERMMIIMPLLEDGLSKSDLVDRKKKQCEKHDISYRTIGRYLDAYFQGGYEALKPKVGYKRQVSALPDDFQAILEEAIILRRENPSRSVKDIIRILELEGRIEKDSLSRSTLQRHLQSSGFGAKQIRLYTNKGTAARRFKQPHRCMLFQGDIKYGPYIPITEGGKAQQVYLSVFIDDATRYIVAAKFYENQKTEIIEDSLRNAITRYGKPDAIYVDNGKQYRSEWLKHACNRLGIKLLFAKPYHPEGKGKVEAFNRRMDSFISEAALAKPKSLKELNDMLSLWINEHYHQTIHHGLEGISPETAFRSDKRPLKFVDTNELKTAFLHTTERKVDKIGCISFKGKTYEVGSKFIGRKVHVHYDASWSDQVEIHHKDSAPFMAKEQKIGPECGARVSLPDKQLLKAESSRLLDGLNTDNITGRTSQEVAVVFRKMKAVSNHV